MTIEEAEKFLIENNIPFEKCSYSNEADFYRHIALYPNSLSGKTCKVITLVVRCKNGYKDIELQFNDSEMGYTFEDLYFGEYSFEFFNYKKDLLPDAIAETIDLIIQGRTVIVVANDLKRHRWLTDACYDLLEETDKYNSVIERIQKPPTIVDRLLRSVRQYEIYDYEKYERFIKQ